MFLLEELNIRSYRRGVSRSFQLIFIFIFIFFFLLFLSSLFLMRLVLNLFATDMTNSFHICVRPWIVIKTSRNAIFLPYIQSSIYPISFCHVSFCRVQYVVSDPGFLCYVLAGCVTFLSSCRLSKFFLSSLIASCFTMIVRILR